MMIVLNCFILFQIAFRWEGGREKKSRKLKSIDDDR